RTSRGFARSTAARDCGRHIRRSRRDATHDRAARFAARGSLDQVGDGKQGDGGEARSVPRRSSTRGRRRSYRERTRGRVGCAGRREGSARRMHAGGAMNKLTLDDIKALEARHIVQTYKRQPVAFIRGSGARLYDVDGREYLDLVSGIGVASLGHAHPGLAAAIDRQAPTLLDTSSLYYHALQGQVAARLT